jgi:hypothetical protein
MAEASGPDDESPVREESPGAAESPDDTASSEDVESATLATSSGACESFGPPSSGIGIEPEPSPPPSSPPPANLGEDEHAARRKTPRDK